MHLSRILSALGFSKLEELYLEGVSGDIVERTLSALPLDGTCLSSLRLHDFHSLDPFTFLRHLKHYISALRRLKMDCKDFDVRPEEASTPDTICRPILSALPRFISEGFACWGDPEARPALSVPLESLAGPSLLPLRHPLNASLDAGRVDVRRRTRRCRLCRFCQGRIHHLSGCFSTPPETFQGQAPGPQASRITRPELHVQEFLGQHHGLRMERALRRSRVGDFGHRGSTTGTSSNLLKARSRVEAFGTVFLS